MKKTNFRKYGKTTSERNDLFQLAKYIDNYGVEVILLVVVAFEDIDEGLEFLLDCSVGADELGVVVAEDGLGWLQCKEKGSTPDEGLVVGTDVTGHPRQELIEQLCLSSHPLHEGSGNRASGARPKRPSGLGECRHEPQRVQQGGSGVESRDRMISGS